MLFDQQSEALFCIQMDMVLSPSFIATLVVVYVMVSYLVMTRVYTGFALSVHHFSNVSQL